MEFDPSWFALLRPGASDRFFDRAPLPPFRPRTREFCFENAWWLCELSRLIYRQNAAEIGPAAPPPSREAFLGQAGLREVAAFENGANFCTVTIGEGAAGDPFAVLTFRGTRGFEGWLSNLNTMQTLWPRGGSVHCGFKDDFLGLWERVAGFLTPLDLTLFYTGHSLGGALAVLAASVRPPLAVYTFGAPRVGDAAFAHALRRVPIFRIELARDIVPTVPPSAIPFDFDHPGLQVILTPLPMVDREPASLRQFSDPPEFLSSHAPVNYTALIEKRLDEAAPTER
jgi:hypothetical protein